MPSASRIAHAGLPFANPMSEAAVDAALAALPLPARPRILDTGCGSGEMLLRALRLDPTLVREPWVVRRLVASALR